MGEVLEEYRGCLIFGFAVGDNPPYQSKARIEIPLSWGKVVEGIPLDGRFDTEREAMEWGLTRARIWINDHAEELPPQPGPTE